MTATAPVALDAQQRSTLERLVIRARSLLEEDLAAQAEGRFGIHLDGTVEDEAALPDDTTDMVTRRDLEQIINHLGSLGEDPAGAVARLLREASFTHLNRLVAIRIAEAIGLLPESLANGPQSQGFKDLGEVMPVLAGDYRAYVRLCGDELAADAPALFDPRNPLLALEPSTAAFDGLVALVSSAETEEIWRAPDTLGWAYQFFNTGDERREMREFAAPRNSRELAVRNQFFTPRYVVDFLVQNTLGRRLIESDPEGPLLNELPLLVDPPTEQGVGIDLSEVKCLDPACGSGHFLLGCYDLLERAWEVAGTSASDSAPKIVAALWGVDIDPRCAQVASAAIILRARRNCRDRKLPRPNVVTARGLPGGSAALPAGVDLTAEQRALIDRVSDVLSDAPVLGVLLKAEQALEREIRHGAFGGGAEFNPGVLELTDEAAKATERQLLDHLQAIADQASSSVVERLLAAEADDALRLVEVVRQQYDVVLMNPPYGSPAAGSEVYLQAAYEDTWTELYAAFVSRGLALLQPNGYVGALTSSQYFVTKRLGEFRSDLIRNHRPIVLVDLGGGVLQGATVNTAACVLPKRRASGDTLYFDATQLPPSARAAQLAEIRLRAERRDIAGFDSIPGSPLALHMPSSLVEMWDHGARLEPALAKVRTGCKSFDDSRFLRAAWEVGAAGLQRGWRRYLKGGDYQPYVAWSHLVIDWREDGRRLREMATSQGRLAQVMQSSTHWGSPGLCYPRMSSVGFAARLMPAGEIFADQSIAILPREDVDPILLLGLLNSTPVAEILQVFGRGRATENGSMKSLPFDRSVVEKLAPVRPQILELCRVFSELEQGDETASTFLRPAGILSDSAGVADSRRGVRARAKAAQHALDDAVRVVLGASGRLDPDLPSRVDLLDRVLPDPSRAAEEWSDESLSYLFGVAVGRWDPRLARRSYERDTTERLLGTAPSAPPGSRGDDHETADVDNHDHPLATPPDGLLVDEPGHPWDVEAALVRSAEALFVDPVETIEQLLRVAGVRSLREYMRKKFFKSHLARYTRSRRKAPIYWPITLPSREWGCWVYAPAFSRETLYSLAVQARRRERLADEAIVRLRREHLDGGSRPQRRLAAELDAEETLASELRRFRGEAERIAGLGWEPDLDDGIILCAAPLADLFPAWPEAKAARAELRKGEHEWATVAAWADQL